MRTKNKLFKFALAKSSKMNSQSYMYPNLLNLIGKTPLIKLNKIALNFKGTYLAKWEAFNPGHSNKDRIALHIIQISRNSVQ